MRKEREGWCDSWSHRRAEIKVEKRWKKLHFHRLIIVFWCRCGPKCMAGLNLKDFMMGKQRVGV